MGQQQSKSELLSKQAIMGNVEAIKVLCRDGAGPEWVDEKGKTPLIVACMSSDRVIVARTLIELGANVNAYRPGRHGGTPLHHAAKRGLSQSVQLLLSHGANPLIRNDNCQTPLDVARTRGFSNVVRTIENHICLFSGWMLEFYGPGFLKTFSLQLLSRQIWVVIIPCGPGDPTKPLQLELLTYSTSQNARPDSVISLWNANIGEPKFNLSEPSLIIFDKSTKKHYRFGYANAGDKQQLKWLYNACKGIPQVMPNHLISGLSYANDWVSATDGSTINGWCSSSGPSSSSAIHKPVKEEKLDWVDATDDYSHNGWGVFGSSEVNSSSRRRTNGSDKKDFNGWDFTEWSPVSHQIRIPRMPVQERAEITDWVEPSAPPVPLDGINEGWIPSGKAEKGSSSSTSTSCVICWEVSVEGACVPCGHMAGCMACLNEIKAKKGDCPVCRSKIDQVIRIYAV